MVKIGSLIVCMVILCMSLTGCGLLSDDHTDSGLYPEECPAAIAAYVIANHDQFLRDIPAMLALREEYEGLTELYRRPKGSPVLIGTVHRGPNHIADEVTLDESLLPPMLQDTYIDSLSFEADGVILCYTDGIGNVTASQDYGFYYSPKDVPVWINAKDKYLYFPMKQEGNGWVPDKSVLTVQNCGVWK